MKFLVKSEDGESYYQCDSPEVVISANTKAELIEAIQQIEALQIEGYYVAGWLSYAAGSALNPHLSVLPDESFPLLTMLASRNVTRMSLEHSADQPISVIENRVDQKNYEQQYEKLIEYILEGDLYQANYSFRSDVGSVVDPYSLFCQLEANHPVPYAAYIETDEWQVVSVSPELFLKRSGCELMSEPMKGTAERGLSFLDDQSRYEQLATDEKNCAENLMIVDLMRNDLGKICETGSVQVPELFSVQRFHSLHQMVSRVSGRLKTGTGLLEILEATFPAGSITGAPKGRAMQIVAELERDGRKAYTGSVGMFLPGGDFSLNVAIRTLTCQRNRSGAPAELGIGSGVVANSSATVEWRECLLKSDFLQYRKMHSEVFETMLWNGEYVWLDEHLNRLGDSCRYFLIDVDEAAIRTELEKAQRLFDAENYRVRLAINERGQIQVESKKLQKPGWNRPLLKICVSPDIIDSSNRYQYHKTDFRPLYDPGFEAAQSEGFDEMLFTNEHGFIVEGAISNVFLRFGEQWVTPSHSSGLLAGIWREHQRETLEAVEDEVAFLDIRSADQVMLGNSLRMGANVGEIWSERELVWQSSGAKRHVE